MNDTRLIKLIKSFSKDELKSFDKFLKSPFLKPTRNIIPLYEYIIKFYPDYSSPKLQKDKVFLKLFPDEKFNGKRLINLMSDLTGAAEDFLAHNTLHQDEVEFLLNLSKGLLNKKLANESNRINKLIEKKLKPGFSPGKDFISKYRRLNYLKSSYYTEKNEFENIIDCTTNYFEASAIQFIIDYIEIVSSMKTALNTYGKNLENNFIHSILESFDIEKLIKLIEKNDYTNSPLVALHYYKLKTEEKPSDTNFYYNLKSVLLKNLSILDREEKYMIFSHLANYCVKKSVEKNEEFKREGLEIYKLMLENNAYSFSENEFMHVMTYRNIIHFCVSVNNPEWFENFIEKNTECLHPDYRKDLVHYSYAHFYFMKKDFQKSLINVSGINHEYFLFKADLKNIMLKIYYELDYFEQAFSMVDTYKHFLSSTKEISKSFKKIFSNFLNYYFSLLKIKSFQSKDNPSFIKSKIEKEKEIINKVWLLEKSEELIKRGS